jgi:hypothetical protein
MTDNVITISQNCGKFLLAALRRPLGFANPDIKAAIEELRAALPEQKE